MQLSSDFGRDFPMHYVEAPTILLIVPFAANYYHFLVDGVIRFDIFIVRLDLHDFAFKLFSLTK